MNWLMSVYVALLFVVLTPGVVLTLPSKGPLLNKAIVHGLVFAAVFHYTHKAVWRMTEGFQDAPMACPPGTAMMNGVCK